MTGDNIFSGLKVVDLSSFIAGPGAATILSDFGADVVKVEPPEGDESRRLLSSGRSPGVGGRFLYLGTGKRSVLVDPQGVEADTLTGDLVSAADLVELHPHLPPRPGTLRGPQSRPQAQTL